MKIKIYLEPSEDKGYTVIVPSLPGCISEGDTKEEALRNIREAIELYLEPVEDDTLTITQAEEVELAIWGWLKSNKCLYRLFRTAYRFFSDTFSVKSSIISNKSFALSKLNSFIPKSLSIKNI